MNKVTRRLAKYGIDCNDYKTEVRSAAVTTSLWGYKILDLHSLDVWVVGEGVVSIGSYRVESVNEVIDRFSRKRRKRKCKKEHEIS